MPSGRWQQELRRPNISHLNPGRAAEKRIILTSYVEHDDRRGGDPGGCAGQDPEMVLDVQEEVAVILQDSSGQAGDAEGRGDHHPAVTPVRRSGSPGLHLALRSAGCSPARTKSPLRNNPPMWEGRVDVEEREKNCSKRTKPVRNQVQIRFNEIFSVWVKFSLLLLMRLNEICQ